MKLHIPFFYVVLLSIGIMPQAVAQPMVSISEIPRINEIQHPLTDAQWLTQQPPPTATDDAQVVAVRGVRLNPIPTGLEVILDIADRVQPQVFTKSSGNTLIADIPNAVLALPEGQEFRSLKPAQGIASVTVTQPNANSIRVTVTGTQAVPTAKVIPGASGVVLSVNTTIETPETPEKPSTPTTPGVEPGEATESPEVEEGIEIVVTGEEEEEGYQVDRATTGTRTDTPILEIPRSVNVVPQQVIEDQGALGLEETLRNVPGVITNTSPRDIFNSFTIRGFDSFTFLRNGITYDRNEGLDFANLERVEVLKGPASILYGQSQPGGVVNVLTKQPLRVPFYSTKATVGSYELYRGTFDLTGPLNDNATLLYRLNGAAQNSESFVDFVEIDRYLIAPVLTWLINDNTKLTFEGEYRDAQYPNERGLPAVGTVLDNPIGEIPIERFLGEPSFDRNNRRNLQLSYDFEHRLSEVWSIRNTFLATRQRSDQDSTVSENLLENNRTLERFAIIQLDTTSRNIYNLKTDIVGNFNTGKVKHELLLGFDLSWGFFESNFEGRKLASIDIFDPVYDSTPGEVDFTENNETRTNGLGIYIQDQISISDNLIFVLGGRFDSVEQEVEDFVDSANDSSQQDEAFSPNVGIVYKPIESVSLYASYSRSFEQAVGTTFDNELFEPQRGTQYEVGVKADLLDSRLLTTLALFDLKLSNVLTEDLENLGGFEVQTGEQRSRGIELDVVGRILPGWNIIASYAYIDTEVTEDNIIPEGNLLINVPENSFSLWTTYELQSGGLQGLGFGIGLFYVGERQGDLENTFSLPSYLRTDAAIYYRRNNFRTQLNIKNLFDINYFEAANGDLRVFPGSPLTVLGTVEWEF